MDKMNTTTNGRTTCRPLSTNRNVQTRIVLGLGPTLFSANLSYSLRTLGWHVVTTANGEEARRSAVGNGTHVAIVPFVSNDLLVTAKIINAMPSKTKVVMVTITPNERAVQFAEMMGIPVVAESEGVAAIVAAATDSVPVIGK